MYHVIPSPTEWLWGEWAGWAGGEERKGEGREEREEGEGGGKERRERERRGIFLSLLTMAHKIPLAYCSYIISSQSCTLGICTKSITRTR